MKKDYWIDADVDGTPRIGNWQGKNKQEAIQNMKDFYIAKGVPDREIIIRQVK